jgi:hypothetical protein
MNKPLKDGVPLNCKIDKKTAEQLEAFIKATKLSKTATVERALHVYIESYYKTGKI